MKIKELNEILKDKEKRLEIYRKAYEIHLEDIEDSISYGLDVDGICSNLNNAIRKLYDYYTNIKDSYLPEFHDLKPKDEGYLQHWWDTKNYVIRKEIYEKYLINI